MFLKIVNLLFFPVAYVICRYNEYKYRRIDLFDYIKLSHFPNVYPRIPLFTLNEGYGNAKAVRNLSPYGFNPFIDYLEHGMIFSESVNSLDGISVWKLKMIRRYYTFSEYRKECILKWLLKKGIEPTCIVVGPYILGTKILLSDEKMKGVRRQLGKVLLVFPAHSLKYLKNEYKIDYLLSEIEKIKFQFDSILICLHLYDIQSGYAQIYEKQGYKVVTNGHTEDPNFLARQRTLIELSTVTMGNSLGTHIGYSIALKRPHYYFKQTITTKFLGDGHTNKLEYESIENEKKEELSQVFFKEFGHLSFKITKRQIDLVERYWGNLDCNNN
ncbi:hypothetical protein [Phocaeicola sp.]